MMNRIVKAGSVCVFSIVCSVSSAQDTTSVTIDASQDTFTRQVSPTATLGAAAALSVSGVEGMNADGDLRERADAWMQFDTTPFITAFDAEFGSGDWEVVTVTIALDEVGAPRNSIFSVGVGMFEVFWVADDSWTEGLGRPNGQGTATGDSLSFARSEELRDSELDDALGTFSNAGVDGTVVFELAVTDRFATDLASGRSVSLALVAVDANLGYTFHSRQWTMPDERPKLTVTAQEVGEDALPDDMPVDDMMPDDMDNMDDTPVDDMPDDDGMINDDEPDDTPVDDGNNTPAQGMCGAGMMAAVVMSMFMMATFRLSRGRKYHWIR